MAVAQLSKLTVPLPGAAAGTQGLLMPKLKYRFRVTFTSFGVTSPSTELTKQVISCGRPEVSMDAITIDVYNSQIKYASKPKWGDITLVLRDDVNGEVSKRVGEQVQKQFDFFEQASAASGIDYKFSMTIEILDGGNGASAPNVLESFEVDGCFLSKVKYSDAEYKTSDPMQIDLTIPFDNAVQLNGGGNLQGIGATVARTIGTSVTG